MQTQLKKVRSSCDGPGYGRRDDRGQEGGVLRSMPWSESLSCWAHWPFFGVDEVNIHFGSRSEKAACLLESGIASTQEKAGYALGNSGHTGRTAGTGAIVLIFAAKLRSGLGLNSH